MIGIKFLNLSKSFLFLVTKYMQLLRSARIMWSASVVFVGARSCAFCSSSLVRSIRINWSS